MQKRRSEIQLLVPKISLKFSFRLSKSSVQKSLKVYMELLWIACKNYSPKSTSISKTSSFTIQLHLNHKAKEKSSKTQNQSFTSSNPPLAYLVDARLLLSCPLKKKKNVKSSFTDAQWYTPLPFCALPSILSHHCLLQNTKKPARIARYIHSTPIRVGFDLRRPQRARGSACPTSRLVRDRLPYVNHSVPSLLVSLFTHDHLSKWKYCPVFFLPSRQCPMSVTLIHERNQGTEWESCQSLSIRWQVKVACVGRRGGRPVAS